jgi:hypothetical protein
VPRRHPPQPASATAASATPAGPGLAAALTCSAGLNGGSGLAGGPVAYDPASHYEELYGTSTTGELVQKVWEAQGFPNPGWSKWIHLNGNITGTPSAVYVFHVFHDDGAWESETLGNIDGSKATVTLAWL